MRKLKSSLVLVSTLTFIFAAACGDSDNNDDNNNGGGGTGEQPSSVTEWTEIDYSQLLPTPPEQCDQPEHFEVFADGRWEWDWCADQKSGTLSAEELSDLNNRAVQVKEAGIEPEVCMEIAYSGDDRIKTTYVNEGERVLHTKNMRGSCYSGNMGAINALEEQTRELMKKYTGVSIPEN